MYHPSILAAYLYRRTQCESLAIDACTDVAEYNRVPVRQLAQFLITTGIATGIDADRLSMLA